MLLFPESTQVNKRIPKQRFYENLTISPELKRVFVDCIKQINWVNSISPSTMNIFAGEEVTELQVFYIELQKELPDEGVLKQIDKEIPYHILFLLVLEGKVKASIGYKEENLGGKTAFKVTRYYSTEWLEPDDILF